MALGHWKVLIAHWTSEILTGHWTNGLRRVLIAHWASGGTGCTLVILVDQWRLLVLVAHRASGRYRLQSLHTAIVDTGPAEVTACTLSNWGCCTMGQCRVPLVHFSSGVYWLHIGPVEGIGCTLAGYLGGTSIDVPDIPKSQYSVEDPTIHALYMYMYYTYT